MNYSIVQVLVNKLVKSNYFVDSEYKSRNREPFASFENVY
jgi:hypothetical protein